MICDIYICLFGIYSYTRVEVIKVLHLSQVLSCMSKLKMKSYQMLLSEIGAECMNLECRICEMASLWYSIKSKNLKISFAIWSIDCKFLSSEILIPWQAYAYVLSNNLNVRSPTPVLYRQRRVPKHWRPSFPFIHGTISYLFCDWQVLSYITGSHHR